MNKKIMMELSFSCHYILELMGINIIINQKYNPLTSRGLTLAEKEMYRTIVLAINQKQLVLLNKTQKLIFNKLLDTKDKTVKKVLNSVAKKIKTDSGGIVKASLFPIVDNREKFYKFVKKTISSKLNVKYKFGLKDNKALARLGKFDKWWVGKHFKDDATLQVKNLFDKIPKKVPLARKELAAYLNKNVTKIVRSEAYWRLYSANALNRARSYSQMQTFVENEIKRYEVVEAGDERMCPMCDRMNGEIMEVEVAIEKWEKIDNAKKPDDIKEIMRWGGADDKGVFVTVHGKKKRITEDHSAEELQAMGLDSPPYHGNCRGGVSPVFK